MGSSNNETSWGEVFFWGFIFIVFLMFDTVCGNKEVNSFFKEECYHCSATGKVDCNYCYGEGKKDCYRCNGSGTERCSSCIGSGQRWTYDYGYNSEGTYGYFYGYFPCNDCHQTGEEECSFYDCEEGKVECSYCYGKGKKTCSYCNGDGYK